MVVSFLWSYFHVRPLVIEYVFRQSGINQLLKLIKALSIPNFETSLNELKIKKAEEVVNQVISGLKKKENFVLWPAGRLKYTGKEILGGTSGVHTILQESPDAKIVLVRTVGLWGSSFSKAYTGTSPDIKSTIWLNIKALFKNFIFFMPRRKVAIEFEYISELPKDVSRLELNRYLENWYNRYPTKDGLVDTEPVNKVSYSIFRDEYLKPLTKEKKSTSRKKTFKSQTEETVYKEIARISERSEDEITQDMLFAVDLGFDSLDLAELISFLSVHFDVVEIHPQDLLSVRNALEIAEGHKEHKVKDVQFSFAWPKEKKRKKPILPTGKTIMEAFLNVLQGYAR